MLILLWVTELLLPVMVAVWTVSLVTTWSACAGSDNPMVAKLRMMLTRLLLKSIATDDYTCGNGNFGNLGINFGKK
jgi:hypothetical protein